MRRKNKLVYFAGIIFHEDLFNHFPSCDRPTVKADGQTLEGVLSQHWGTAVAQWLRCCATNRKVSGSNPAGIIGIFH